jgi:DNA topoisomerase-3
MKTLFFAEKPSVAKEYKTLLEQLELQSFQTKEGYFESDKYYITWGYGHLVTLGQPDDYGWGDWTIENLPMLPTEWKYIVKNDGGAKKQFKIIKDLLSKSATVVNGADPDREGELIFRLILHLSSKNSIPQFRFWNRSLTFEDLKDAWIKKKPGSEYNLLYAAANCRQRADWLIGMNLSRAYSLKSDVRGISVGRVQTPTLAMIVERDLDIENWKQSFFSTLVAQWLNIQLNYVGEDPNTTGIIEFISAGEISHAKSLQAQLVDTQAQVVKYDSKQKLEQPPVFFNLADLQKAANNKYKITAEQTLNAAQSLYEKKILSYPRTDCNYLTEEMYEGSMKLLKKIIEPSQLPFITSEQPRSFNSSKVTAHTALVLVSTPGPDQITATEDKIYSLVRERFIEAFGTPKTYTESTLLINCKGHYFYTAHKHTTDKGYLNLFNTKDEEQNTSSFPTNIEIGLNAPISNVSLQEKERTKPKHFTESTLLSAMENCSKKLEEKDLREALKSAQGIGTPATRSNIIEGLKKRQYIEEQKGSLISTPKGKSLIHVVDENVASPIMTAQWESKLSDIEHGTLNWKSFYDDITSFTSSTVSTVLNSHKDQVQITRNTKPLQKCLKCKDETLSITPAGAFCKNEQCAFKLYKKQFGKTLTDTQFNNLLIKKDAGKIKLKSKVGKEYSAHIILDNTFNVTLKF